MSSLVTPLRAALVGCNMGRNQANALEALNEYDLVAVCDINEEAATKITENTKSAKVYVDYSTMLDEVRPDVIVIATPTKTHAPFTFQAIEAGVKGIYCEKPMAIHFADAQAMVDRCNENGIKLAIGHQRRLDSIFIQARIIIEEGVLGDIKLIRGSCAGDVLSDGTHTIDTILHLLGDCHVNWVFGQVERKAPASEQEVLEDKWAFTGHRYGHVVESGAIATFELDHGIRAEILTGDLRFPNSNYQEFEIIGTKGRLWRPGDGANPELLLAVDGEHDWKPVQINDSPGVIGFEDVFSRFAATINQGNPFSLSGENALRSFEIVMAIYESARLRKRINLPLEQDRFPLELMVEAGEL